MLKSISIESFRCFSKVELPRLGRVNVIVGDNGAGKTSLLEAIYLLSGSSPELALKLRVWRGLEQIPIGDEDTIYDEIWGDLFFKFDRKKQVTLSGVDSDHGGRIVSIRWQDQTDLLLRAGVPAVNATVRRAPIQFEYMMGDKVFQLAPMITSEGIKIATAQIPVISGRFIGNWIKSTEYASIFSRLSRRKMDAEILDLIQREFPRIESLSVETMGSEAMIFASVSGIPNKIPITLLSAGVNKLLMILLAIASHPKGYVSIDEIENGFYYERLPRIWRMIRSFAEVYDTQIFASTHSQECITALVNAYADDLKDVVLIRSTMEKSGEAILESFPGELIEGAMRLGEVR